LADAKTDETAICLLGTARRSLALGRESVRHPRLPVANNNARDPEVRAEYAVQPNGAPYDPVSRPEPRPRLQRLLRREKGRIDVPSVAALFATSPINLATPATARSRPQRWPEKWSSGPTTAR